jgi:S1-C subfamily serine protease
MAHFDPRTWTRETRLLVLTILLSVSVLLALARLRFPERTPIELPARPFQPLPARSIFDDAAAAVSRVLDRVRTSLIVVRVQPAVPERRHSYALADLLSQPPPSSAVTALAYRIRPDAAVVLSNRPPVTDARTVQAVLQRDPLRGLAVLKVQQVDGWTPRPAGRAVGAPFVFVAEATPRGIAMRPLFGATAEAIPDPYWNRPVVPLGSSAAAATGAMVFSTEGEFLGTITSTAGTPAIVPPAALLEAAADIGASPPPVSTLGIHLQSLDAALSVATGASTGVVVSGVDLDAPAAALRSGDVIVGISGIVVSSPQQALAAIAVLPAGEPVRLTVWRMGKEMTLDVTPRTLKVENARVRPSTGQGWTLRRSARGVEVAALPPTSAAFEDGLRAGDVIISLSGAPVRTPAAVTAAYSALAPGQGLLLVVERDATPLVIALVGRAR